MKQGLQIGCLAMLLALLVLLAPAIWLGGAMVKASYDVQRARDEFKRTVNPDELRAWVMAQYLKHPQGGDIEDAVAEWPSKFPRFSRKRFDMLLLTTDESQRPRDTITAILVWNFFDQGLKITIWMKPDGTPVEMGDESNLHPERKWDKGITFSHLHK